jgi:hypothetical protein
LKKAVTVDFAEGRQLCERQTTLIAYMQFSVIISPRGIITLALIICRMSKSARTLSTSSLNQMLPKLVAFDLDGTIWSPGNGLQYFRWLS